MQRFLLGFWILLMCTSVFAQVYPVSFEQRIRAADVIVRGEQTSASSFVDASSGNLFTRNLVKVTAYLKGSLRDSQIAIITPGGVIHDRATLVSPSLKITPNQEYVFLLDADQTKIPSDPAKSSLRQFVAYADQQGAIAYQAGMYRDMFAKSAQSEIALFRAIEALTGMQAVSPTGHKLNLRDDSAKVAGQKVITNLSPNPSVAGTSNPSDFLTIDGSGFGSTAGTVLYANADDGGATFITSGVASDNVSWSDLQIVNKIAADAGTGPISINGAMTSAGTLTIQYAYNVINSDFAGFPNIQRQPYFLVDKNTDGGLTFTYNTAFAANTPAIEAFERAFSNWRCASLVNFRVDQSNTSTTAVAALDGENIVTFSSALPAGVLGRATSRFQASATGACNQNDTVWWVDEIDLEFATEPPLNLDWNFGPDPATVLEFDFESVALHELGHAIGLGHVIAPGALMHFSLSEGAETRTIDANSLTAAQAKIAASALPLCFNPAGVNGPMAPLTAGTCDGVPVELQQFGVAEND